MLQPAAASRVQILLWSPPAAGAALAGRGRLGPTTRCRLRPSPSLWRVSPHDLPPLGPMACAPSAASALRAALPRLPRRPAGPSGEGRGRGYTRQRPVLFNMNLQRPGMWSAGRRAPRRMRARAAARSKLPGPCPRQAPPVLGRPPGGRPTGPSPRQARARALQNGWPRGRRRRPAAGAAGRLQQEGVGGLDDGLQLLEEGGGVGAVHHAVVCGHVHLGLQGSGGGRGGSGPAGLAWRRAEGLAGTGPRAGRPDAAASAGARLQPARSSGGPSWSAARAPARARAGAKAPPLRRHGRPPPARPLPLRRPAAAPA
jgi:hypothetical protein